MPGIVGYATAEAGRRPESFISAMARSLEPDTAGFADALFHDERAGLGVVVPRRRKRAPRLAWNSDRSLCLAMAGEIFHAETSGLPADSTADTDADVSDASLFIRLYETFGDEFAERINGAFVAALWDCRSKTLTVVNDRLGLFPLYYARTGSTLLFASGVRALLADPGLSRNTDLLAIAQFLVFDHMLDDRTLLDAVRLLPQASILSFADGKLRIRPYWRLRYPDRYQPRKEPELREELDMRMQQAVKRQTHEHESTGILLSGGLDSRVLLAYLCTLRDPSSLHTCTWGIPHCDDARLARNVSRIAGTDHHFYPLEPDYLLQTAERAIHFTDGHANIVNLHALTIADPFAEFVDVVHKGFLGDAMFGFALQRLFWGDYHEAQSRNIHLGVHDFQGVLNYARDGLMSLGTERFNRICCDAVFDSYDEGLRRSESRQLAIQRLYFDLTQRVPRMTLNGIEVVRSTLDVKLPFADADLIDFSLSIPPGYLFERYIMRSEFAARFPRLAKVPVSDTGLPLVACARDVWLRARQIARWHLNRSGLGLFARPERKPYKDYRLWFRTVLRSWVEDLLLASSALDRGYFKPAAVHRLVQEHMDGSADHTIRLGALLSLELWHRRFID